MPDLVSAQPAPLMNGEQLFSFAALAAKLPGHRSNSHVNASTIFRWATKGVKTANGAIIRLEAIRLGTAWKTSLEAVTRFSASLTSAFTTSTNSLPPPAPTPKQRQRAAVGASRRADEIFGATA